MADAPASGGGSGWGALEVILALVLAIGLISTITGNPIPSLTGSSTKAPVAKTTTTNQPACGIVVSSPTRQEKIGTQIVLSGTVLQCLTNTVPPALTAHVVDSTGASLSAVTSVTVNRSFFGDATFSVSIPLVGTAHSIQAYVIVSGPTHADGSAETVRIPVQLLTADAVPAQSTAAFNTSSTSSTNYYPTPSYTPPVYTAPAPYNPSPNFGQAPSTGSGQAAPTSGGGGGTTF